MEFRKYMHLERFGNDEVQGIDLGDCYIFPKLDGTNASVWLDGDKLQAGSRNRHLSLESDNAGFLEAMTKNVRVLDYLQQYPSRRIYGEWLVPHSLKTYRDDAWRQFYVFDVFDEEAQKYLPYSEYKEDLDDFGIEYIPATTIIKNASYDNLLRELDKNVFLINDGKGVGEGIVIKNYDYKNGFGRTVWAKIVTTSFKAKHKKEMGPDCLMGDRAVEQDIVDKYITAELINKVYAKIAVEMKGWNSRYIPRLLQTVYYDLINEEIWAAIKEFKNPTIDFKKLYTLSIMEIKSIKPEIF